MIPFALIVALAVPDSPPPDALRFGVSPEIVAANIKACELHRTVVITQYSTPIRTQNTG